MNRKAFIIREAEMKDLPDILGLYQQLFPQEDYSNESQFYQTWLEIVNDNKTICFLAYNENIAVGSCTITVIPNLTRNRRPYAVLENVIVASDYRKRGYGRSLIEKAVDFAKQKNCYKIMLLSSSLRTDAHIFYEKTGFDGRSKKGYQLRIL